MLVRMIKGTTEEEQVWNNIEIPELPKIPGFHILLLIL